MSSALCIYHFESLCKTKENSLFIILFSTCTFIVVLSSLFIYTFSGGSSSNLISTDSRDVSPSSVFGATRNTSPVGTNGYLTPRRSYSPSPAAAGGRIPIRKNSFVVTESQYSHVLPSVSPRSSSPAIRTGQWSGRVTPSALETCMETSFISTNNPLQNCVLPNTFGDPLADCAPGPLWHTNLSSFIFFNYFAYRCSTNNLSFDVLLYIYIHLLDLLAYALCAYRRF